VTGAKILPFALLPFALGSKHSLSYLIVIAKFYCWNCPTFMTTIPVLIICKAVTVICLNLILCFCFCLWFWFCRTANLVEGVLQGRNGTVFCYGATGAGKTYTMLGTMENPGVMVLAIKDLFSKVRQRSYDGNHSIQLSYLEIYNETVRDLLSPGRPLHLREDKQVHELNCLTMLSKQVLFSELITISES
jgi:hypothetical protein